MKKYEYKVVDRVDLLSLNEYGEDGWLVVDRSYGNALLVREYEGSERP
jgi:hypothetical protein